MQSDCPIKWSNLCHWRLQLRTAWTQNCDIGRKPSRNTRKIHRPLPMLSKVGLTQHRSSFCSCVFYCIDPSKALNQPLNYYQCIINVLSMIIDWLYNDISSIRAVGVTLGRYETYETYEAYGQKVILNGSEESLCGTVCRKRYFGRCAPSIWREQNRL